ncbi:MAG: peptidylprolyl isomerase [Herpetosiphonaceae bacterium]|nr:peptidylprolyl isomerase [Herpetosiphonaceae bacterium]
MRRRLPTLLLSALLFGLLAGCGEDVATMQSPVMARVGQTNLTVAQYTQYADVLVQRDMEAIAQSGATPDQVRQAAYLQLIREEIFLNEARRAGVGVDAETAAEVDQSINQAIQPVGKGIAFADYQTLAKSSSFPSFTDLRTNSIRQTTLDKYVRTIQAEGVPPKLHLYLIILPIPDETDQAKAEVKSQADDLVAQLRSGASFEALARTYSAQQESASRGGELGYITLDQTPPELQPLLGALEVNQISDPFEFGGGWFIFKIADRLTGFSEWQEVLQTPAGQTYIDQKVAEYTTSGDFLPYILVEDLPLPAIQQ